MGGYCRHGLLRPGYCGRVYTGRVVSEQAWLTAACQLTAGLVDCGRSVDCGCQLHRVAGRQGLLLSFGTDAVNASFAFFCHFFPACMATRGFDLYTPRLRCLHLVGDEKGSRCESGAGPLLYSARNLASHYVTNVGRSPSFARAESQKTCLRNVCHYLPRLRAVGTSNPVLRSLVAWRD